jgi:hypothetical protein
MGVCSAFFKRSADINSSLVSSDVNLEVICAYANTKEATKKIMPIMFLMGMLIAVPSDTESLSAITPPLIQILLLQ